jgi:hypothetical protein
VCINGKCKCQPDCTGKICGSNGCEELYRTYVSPDVCKPNCSGKLCTDSDGCGNTCSSICSEGEFCTDSGVCCKIGDCSKPGCKCPFDQVCYNGKCCMPNNPECVNSLCGQYCGTCGCGIPDCTCGDKYTCTNNKCVCKTNPICGDCGIDGCGNICGTCNSDETCVNNHCVEKPIDFCKLYSDPFQSEVVRNFSRNHGRFEGSGLCEPVTSSLGCKECLIKNPVYDQSLIPIGGRITCKHCCGPMGCVDLQNVDLSIAGLSLDDHGYIISNTTGAEEPGYCISKYDCSRINIDPRIDNDGECRSCPGIMGNSLGLCCNTDCNEGGFRFPCPTLFNRA